MKSGFRRIFAVLLMAVAISGVAGAASAAGATGAAQVRSASKGTQKGDSTGKTPMANISHWTLANGLEVFAIENHAAPLAYIEIAVRAGGITQTRENAGLFHLYEHMMFKGNSLYHDAAAVQKAIGDLGSPDWNGSTGLECVNYYFTVPASRLREGMEFWSAAIREPLLDAAELEREKKVVLSEITANDSDPGYLASKCALQTMFPASPWRVDPSGSPSVVQNATVDDIRDIQRTYYVPNNAALFVAGDIDSSEVHTLAQALYGQWQRAAEVPAPAKNSGAPLDAHRLMLSVNDKVSPETAYITVYLRAPDMMSDKAATYAADMALYLLNDPTGPLAAAVLGKKDLGITSADRIGAGYQTRRASSLMTFSAMMNDSGRDLPRRALSFLATVQDDVCAAIASGQTKIPQQVFRKTLTRREDSDIIDSETAEAVKSSLRYWWTVADANYYYGYNDALMRTTEGDVRDVLARYVVGKYALVIVSLNPAVYEAQKDAFDAAGFDVIQKEDALWWKE